MGERNIPRAWVDASVMPIYKRKESSSMPSSYRPIFLLNVIGKFYASMVVARLNKKFAAKLAETQQEFWKDFPTERVILAIPTVTKNHWMVDILLISPSSTVPRLLAAFQIKPYLASSKK